MKYLKFRLLIIYLLASLVTFVIASIANTQFVLNDLIALGVEVPLMTRLETSFSDLLGMAPLYGLMVLAGLGVAFSLVGLCLRYIAWSKKWVFPIGGALAIATILLSIQPIFNITLIAGARSPLGFAIQCVAGLIGGWVFAHFLPWAKKRFLFR